MDLIDRGLGYSAVNSARCALSAILGLFDNQVFGCHDIVTRFMKGVFNSKPPVARYSCSWDVNSVLTWLRGLSPIKFLSLKDLTLKLVMLLALVSGQRSQTLQMLDLSECQKGASFCFGFGTTLKHSRPGKPAPVVDFKPFPPDRRLCVYTVMKEYIKRTKLLRGSESRLLISYIKPHRRVTRDTVARWVKWGLQRSGINTEVYKPHSTRMASTSHAFQKGLSLEVIMAAAGWSQAGTFAKFYHKPVKTFANTILQS